MWENPNPTAEFAAQTINLSSTDFDYYVTYINSDISAAETVSVCSIKGRGFRMISAGGAGVLFRIANWVEPNQLTISDNIIVGTNNTTLNKGTIPYKIYGYKF